MSGHTLCMEGSRAEYEVRQEDTRNLYWQTWEMARVYALRLPKASISWLWTWHGVVKGFSLRNFSSGGTAPASLKFYITGVFYLLIGIIIGAGLWLNGSVALHIKVPLEAHMHANSRGFMSLAFAGLLIDFIPMFTGQPLGSKTAASMIYWE